MPALSPTVGSASLLDREISLLAFNARVLAMASDAKIPLLERLKFLTIVSSNMDEFFEVRVAELASQLRNPPKGQGAILRTQMHTVHAAAHQLVAQQYEVYNRMLLPELHKIDVRLAHHAERDAKQREWVKQYFFKEVLPLLTPIGLDPSHPFPQVVNKSLNFIVELKGKDAFGRTASVAILKAPRVLPRVIPLPAELCKGKRVFVLLSSVIRAHLADVFGGREVIGYSQFRVTRDSDLWVDEEDVKNLRQALSLELHQRQFGNAVRLEVAATCPDHLAQFLLKQFDLDEHALYRVNGPVNLVRLNQLLEYLDLPDYRYPRFVPVWPRTLQEGDPLFQVVARRDVLLHHPFESFEPVIDFLRTAATDPKVVAIKITVYRTGVNSVLMESLIEAARRGKEVTVIVELKARFDEEANINWADKLEDAGAQVVYGVMGLKTHAKLALIVRREDKGLRYYAHLGTGNYHPTTAKLYTDFGLLTANASLCEDVARIFLHLTSLTKVQRLAHLWLAPFTLARNIIREIRHEAELAKARKPARIVAKMNALLDESVIGALYAASQAGVKVDLIVRGACSLRAGVKGLSENIRVRSIVGRFLEHHRIYYFGNGGTPLVLLSSADWMGRNLFRRVEVAFPVLDPQLAERVVKEGLMTYLEDSLNAWDLQPDGTYVKARAKRNGTAAQQELALNISDAPPWI